MENDVGAACGAVTFAHGVLGRTVALPAYGFSALLITESIDCHLVGNHKSGIESEAEVTDYVVGVVFVLCQKIFGTGECNLVDVFVNIFGCHAYAVVADCECAGFLIDRNRDLKLAYFAFEIAERRECAEFLSCIDSVRHEFAEEYFVVAVEKFFDNGKNVLGCYTDCTFLHGYSVFLCFTLYFL